MRGSSRKVDKEGDSTADNWLCITAPRKGLLKALTCTCRRKLPAARAPRAPSLKRGPFCSTLAEPTRVESLDNACPVLVILDDAPEDPLTLHVEKYRILAKPRKCINRQLCSSCWRCTAKQRMNQVAKKSPKFRHDVYNDAVRERLCEDFIQYVHLFLCCCSSCSPREPLSVSPR